MKKTDSFKEKDQTCYFSLLCYDSIVFITKIILGLSVTHVLYVLLDVFSQNLHFFSLYFFGELAVHGSFFVIFSSVAHQPRTIPGGNPPGDLQSAVCWGDTGFEPRTAGQQSIMLPLSHHASLFSLP